MQLCRGCLPRAALWVWASVVVGTASAAPEQGVSIENVRVGLGESNAYKLGTWTPIWVQFRGGSERFSGTLEVVVPDDDGTPTSFRQVVDVGPRQGQRVTTYARPGSNNPDFTLRLYDPSGRRRGEDVVASDRSRLTELRPQEILLATLGDPQGVELIPSLSDFSDLGNQASRGNVVTVARLDASGGYLPGRWYGYDSAQAVVLDTNNGEVMATLDALRGQALAEWVRRGGHLVVAVGANWQRVRDSFLGPILPCVPNGQDRVGDLGTLESFAGANRPITPPGAAPVMVAKLEGIEERGGRVLNSGITPLVVRGPYGFGRVTVVALDVNTRPFADWADRPLFWIRALDLRRQATNAAGTGTRLMGGGGQLYQSGVSDLSTRLRQSLEQFPGVQLVPFGWVAFFIFLYILLIGPGDYLFLKKVLKRMELTWITFPAIVVTVSLLAYYAAYSMKGTTLRVNKIDVVDIDQPTGLARGRSWMNVFSPQNRDYGVSVVPLPLDRDPPADGSPARPPAGTEMLVSWFGVPENEFGGMGGGSRFGASSRGYSYEPVGGAEHLEGARIPIWSTKCFTARWFGPSPALIESDLRSTGPDLLDGSLTNRLKVPLQNAMVAYGREVYILKTIAPGATIQVHTTDNRLLATELKKNMSPVRVGSTASSREGNLDRNDLMLAMMFHGSMATVTGEALTPSAALRDLDLTGQLALNRPMLVARIDRPAAQLNLAGAPNLPKIEQSTILRIILPLASTQVEDSGPEPTADIPPGGPR